MDMTQNNVISLFAGSIIGKRALAKYSSLGMYLSIYSCYQSAEADVACRAVGEP